MNTSNLVSMANRIGQFFASIPGRDEALFGIVQHIQRFWERRMRTELLAHLDRNHGEGLDAMVLDALRAHRDLL
ncbi:MAG: formate dehydrogenase subunit delta [Burkholderiales bacterium]|jgi:formate dehydrogenase subunit delta|nr:formate dehydrogenase subunit delta [Burkholderiales bacterium]